MRLINDSFLNFENYSLPKADLIITDIPYNIGKNAYASRPEWYADRDNYENPEKSDLADTCFFNTDKNFSVDDYLKTCAQLLKPEQKGEEPGCIITFCSFEQQFELIQTGKKHGFKNYMNLVFYKNYCSTPLKANQKILRNTEYGIILYRMRLPKFRNEKKTIGNCFIWRIDKKTPHVHPTQKPLHLLENLIWLFSDPGDIVADLCAGSGVTLLAAESVGRRSYGFEIEEEYYKAAKEKVLCKCQRSLF